MLQELLIESYDVISLKQYINIAYIGRSAERKW